MPIVLEILGPQTGETVFDAAPIPLEAWLEIVDADECFIFEDRGTRTAFEVFEDGSYQEVVVPYISHDWAPREDPSNQRQFLWLNGKVQVLRPMVVHGMKALDLAQRLGARIIPEEVDFPLLDAEAVKSYYWTPNEPS